MEDRSMKRSGTILVRMAVTSLVLGVGLLAAGATRYLASGGEEEETPDVKIKVRNKEPKVIVIKGDQKSKGGYLGVQIREETKAAEGGARVDEVVSDSPADKAGIQDGDIIVGFDGEAVHGPASLTERIHAAKPGDKVVVEVLRDGHRKKLDVELGSRPKSQGFFYGFGDDDARVEIPNWDQGELKKQLEKYGIDKEHLHEQLKGLHERLGRGGFVRAWRIGSDKPRLGVQLVDTTPELREFLGGGKDGGVLVGKVIPGTPAEKAGIRVGDLITSVDGGDIDDSGELIETLSDKNGTTVEIGIIRDHKPLRIKAEIPKDEEEDSEAEGPQALYRAPGDSTAPIAPIPPRALARWNRVRAVPPAPPAPPAPGATPLPPAPPAFSMPRPVV